MKFIFNIKIQLNFSMQKKQKTTGHYIMKSNLTEQKQEIVSCFIFKLSFSAIKSVQHSLIKFLLTIGKMNCSKGLNLVGQKFGLLPTGRSGIEVCKRTIRSQLSSRQLTSSSLRSGKERVKAYFYYYLPNYQMPISW